LSLDKVTGTGISCLLIVITIKKNIKTKIESARVIIVGDDRWPTSAKSRNVCESIFDADASHCKYFTLCLILPTFFIVLNQDRDKICPKRAVNVLVYGIW